MRMTASIALADLWKSSAVPYLQNAIAAENDEAVRFLMKNEPQRLQQKEKKGQPAADYSAALERRLKVDCSRFLGNSRDAEILLGALAFFWFTRRIPGAIQ
jgi:hypothetical protein